MKLLHIDSALLTTPSLSRELSAAVVDAWHQAEPDIAVTYRDLNQTPPPILTGSLLRALRGPADDGSTDGFRPDADLATLETILDEFLTADAVVVGAPMYNFSVAATLKSWIDALAQPGRTFTYTPQGPRGLAGGKRVVIVSTRGNVYSRAPNDRLDHQERYLADVMNFLGITQIDVVRAEGVNLDADQREAAIRHARDQIARLFDHPPAGAAATP